MAETVISPGKVDAGSFTGGPWGTIGKASDIVSNFLPQPTEYSGDKGGITQGMDGAYDKIADVASNFGPYGKVVSGAMKLNALAGKGVKRIGGGTDGMTTADAILGSNFLGPLGWINGWGGGKADTINKNNDTFAQMGSSYGGLEEGVDTALTKSGKKYGLVSLGARNKANDFIHQMGQQQSTLTDLSTTTKMNNELLTNQSSIAGFASGFEQVGGYDMTATRAAKFGAKLTIENLDEIRRILNNSEKVDKRENGGHLVKLPKHVSQAIRIAKSGTKAHKKFKVNWDFLDEPTPIGQENKDPNYISVEEQQKLETLKPKSEQISGEGGNVLEDKESPEFTNRLQFIGIAQNGLYEYLDPVTGQRELYDTLFFKNGGSMNVIPEGALHAHKHHMENDENITKKGIPVVVEEDGGELNQQAEIERNEIIFRLEVTKKLEELNKIYQSEDTSQKEKDEAAIEAGKLLTDEILNNTDDRTGLLEEVQ